MDNIITITKSVGASCRGVCKSSKTGDVVEFDYDTTEGATVSKELVDAALNGESVPNVIALGANPASDPASDPALNEFYVLCARGINVGLSAEIDVNIEGLDCVSVLTGPGNIGDSGWTNRDAKRFAEDWECLHREEIAEKLRGAKLLDIMPSEIAKGEYTQLATVEIAEGDWDGLHYTIEGVISARRIDD